MSARDSRQPATLPGGLAASWIIRARIGPFGLRGDARRVQAAAATWLHVGDVLQVGVSVTNHCMVASVLTNCLFVSAQG